LLLLPRAPGTLILKIFDDPDYDLSSLLILLQNYGRFLKSFHLKYKNLQHTDLHFGNVFYDKKTGQFTLIDLGGMESPFDLYSDRQKKKVAGTAEKRGDFEKVEEFIRMITEDKFHSTEYLDVSVRSARLHVEGPLAFRKGYNEYNSSEYKPVPLQDMLRREAYLSFEKMIKSIGLNPSEVRSPDYTALQPTTKVQISEPLDPVTTHYDSVIDWLQLPAGSTIIYKSRNRNMTNKRIPSEFWSVTTASNLTGGNDTKWLIKAVDSYRPDPEIRLSEGENVVLLNSRLGGDRLKTDPCVAFPEAVTRVTEGNNVDSVVLRDLFLLPLARGRSLYEYMYHGSKLRSLLMLFTYFGRFLKAFHLRYDDLQHGDLSLENVFFDERTGQFTLVDAGGLGFYDPSRDTFQVLNYIREFTKEWTPYIKIPAAFMKSYNEHKTAEYDPKLLPEGNEEIDTDADKEKGDEL